MMTLDIPADLNAEDETGLVWTFLDEAAEPDAIRAGAIVVAGSELTPGRLRGRGSCREERRHGGSPAGAAGSARSGPWWRPLPSPLVD